MEKYRLYCLGSRGSRPVEGHAFNEFGGNTTCYVLKKDHYALVIDCGTGLYSAGNLFVDCNKVDIILSHVHYDHILGLLDRSSLPDDSILSFYGDFKSWYNEQTLERFFSEPFWPKKQSFNITNCPEEDEYILLNDELKVFFYKSDDLYKARQLVIEYDGNKLAFVLNSEDAPNFYEKIKDGVNVLVYDGMYTEEEYSSRIGLGHSTWVDGVELAKKINPNRLIITHHRPDSTDTILNRYEKQARESYPLCDFARSGQFWDFPLEKPVEVIKDEDYFDFSIVDYIKKGYRNFIDEVKNSSNRKFYTVYYACLSLSLFSFVFTLIDLMILKTIPFVPFLIVAVLLGINAYVLKRNKNLLFTITLAFMIEIIIFEMAVFIVEPDLVYGFAWMLMVPTAGLFLLGRKLGSIATALAELGLFVLLCTNTGRGLLNANVPENAGPRLMILFFNYYLVCFVIETVRANFSRILKQTTESLESTIQKQTQELRDQNLDLITANSRLEMRNQLLNNTFGQFLPDEIIAKQVESNDKDIISEISNVTILRVGIRKFKKLVANSSPKDIIKILNYYFEKCDSIIEENGGVVLEYVGDSILAVFGAPLKDEKMADKALKSAIELQNVMKEVNEHNIQNGYPAFKIGIGIHAGEAVLGAIGCDIHLKYSAVGNALDFAASLEHRAQEGTILISKEAHSNLKTTVHIKETLRDYFDGFEKEEDFYMVDGIGYPYNVSVIEENE